MKKQILISLCLLTIFCVASVFAQEKSADKENLAAKFEELKTKLSSHIENQCEAFGKYDFEGTPVSFEFEDANIQDVLTFANPSGCDFVMDETVEITRMNMRIYADQIPWNIAFKEVLKWMDLDIKIEGSKFRIIKSAVYSSTNKKSETKTAEKELVIEFLTLNYLPLSHISGFYFGKRINYDDTDKFLFLLRKMVSSRGEIEVDARTNTLIVIDEESRVKNILEFVKLLDESGFTLEEIVNNPNLEIK